MRDREVLVASTLILFSVSCSTSPAYREPGNGNTAPKVTNNETKKSDVENPAVQKNDGQAFIEYNPGNKSKAVEQLVQNTPEPKNETVNLYEVLKKRIIGANPTDQDKLLMVISYIANGELPEAKFVLDTIPSKNRVHSFLRAYILDDLGMHKEARDELRWFETTQQGSGFRIDRIAMCKKVKGYRQWEPDTRNGKVKPGDNVLIYIEPAGFQLKDQGGSSIMHLTYEPELVDEKDRRWPFPNIPLADKEDRITFFGDVREFHQTFLLTLPVDLGRGNYKIRFTVKDEISGKTASKELEVYVGLDSPARGEK